ncbi:MAG TPA: hypothetical protein VK900_07925 [Anaerolineales bacterium]|nr:hypothetical protein [Anaerolineales bacterium]
MQAEKRRLTARDLRAPRQPVEYTRGYGLDEKALAQSLQEQLRVICVTFMCSRDRPDIKETLLDRSVFICEIGTFHEGSKAAARL